ncbi:ribosome quality control complex subunit NEMF homolog [Musca vetustissima]|uniref:ribosome quality control complex subunit NEMF homolog n=1 Tax=Musca vetustissima TaxID=27455 RepID=UPI002AB6293F|nr:ribosome quality control complex subunit NEMF homolog [Musca vetustissima]
MKLRFNSFDIVCGVTELQSLVGLRVNQIYDIDNKTFLIRFQGGGETKKVLLLESGIRFHTTSFEWPKNMAPSGFSMKLRKHLKNKRLEQFSQVGTDRIVDMVFGTGEASYHIILELYDRGNIILTDHEMKILYILRSHQEGEERFAIREIYPIGRVKKENSLPSDGELKEMVSSSAPCHNLKNMVMSVIECGPALAEHILKKHQLDNLSIGSVDDKGEEAGEQQKKSKKNKNKREAAKQADSKPFDIEADLPRLMDALKDGYEIMKNARQNVSKGYIVQRKVEKPTTEEGAEVEHFYQNIEYHPLPLCQYEGEPMATFDTFMLAVDEFYSTLEGQKIDIKTLQQEKEALKKLSNVKLDHAKRLENLTKAQEVDKQKAELITANQVLVDNAILAIRSAIANQMSWPDIHELVKAAQASDPTAASIKQLKLEINHITLKLSDPYGSAEDDEENSMPTLLVDVDLALSAWANARKYYDLKRTAAEKEKKTIDASQKALKSAERKTQQTLKDVRTISTISKARKVYWFEKFYWFISSENYLVIGGRDAQQNELIVKRYMRPTDIYVHAEIQGASSVVVRNPNGGDVPPKTLIEAGTMAISYSVAWDAKVVTNAYWVRSDQVSKTAPTGEYLGTGSFMIRGKKNFLPSCHLIMGLTLLFKLEDSFIEKHRGERKVRTFEEEREHGEHHITTENEKLEDVEEVEVELEEEDESSHSEFPDIQVKVEHDTGRITINNEEKTNVNEEKNRKEQATSKEQKDEEEEATIIAAVPSRKKQQMNAKKRKEEKERKTQQQQIQTQSSETADNRNNQAKRGQKGKLKKIKSKYKDQDEEERQLRMEILKSAGKKTNAPSSDPKLEECALALKNAKPKQQNFEPKPTQENNDDDDGDDKNTGADVDMIDSLTGQPYEDDELLFVIPMIAPYQSIQNYKYKVKLTPGTGKRGRAAKTALTMFGKDKMCTNREKDLLKSIKEEALARNIPGKVKLSAPQLQKFKK